MLFQLFRERHSLRPKAELELGLAPVVQYADKLPLLQESTMISEKTADVAQRATAIYEQKLRIHLEATRMHAFVAIEPDSGDYFVGDTLSEAMQASRKAHPDRLAFGIRVGHSAAVHIGDLNS